jgi:hypothetical protein
MTTKHLALVLLAAGAFASCGSDDDEIGLPDPSSGRGSAAAELASADDVAEKARGDVDCPADIDSDERAEGAPVDDVLGVRPGLTYDEAVNAVLCSHEMLVMLPITRGFDLQTYGHTLRQGFTARFAEREKSSKEYMDEISGSFSARSGNAVTQDMLPGQSKWYVTAMGMPEAERVIHVAREEWFEEGRNPTMASVEQALIKKYGPPSRNYLQSARTLAWIYDPRGRLATETSPLFSSCTASSDPDGGSNFSPDCGIVVGAQIWPLQANTDLAAYMQVGVVDSAGGYQALTTVEQALQALDTKKKADEVSEAQENADAPEL